MRKHRPATSFLLRTLVLCGIGTFLHPSPLLAQKGKDAASRNAWRAAAPDGPWFRNEAGKKWSEFGGNEERFRFVETARTRDYVELFDATRGMRLRLHDGFGQWRQDPRKEWNRWVDGRWVPLASLPPGVKKKPPDYRIRLAYFVPRDRTPTPNHAEKIRVLMHFVREVYQQDFRARGRKTEGPLFQSENGRPVVHLIRGTQTANYYNGGPNYDTNQQWNRIQAEIPPRVGNPQRNVIVLFAETYDSGPAKFEWPGGIALGGRFTADGGLGIFSAWILRPEFCAATIARQRQYLFDTTPITGRIALGHGRMNSPRFEFIEDGFGAVAHELGHALGLPHDTRDDQRFIMGNGFRNLRWNFAKEPRPEKRVGFSDDNARLLWSSRFLAPDLDTSDDVPPTIRLTLPGRVAVGAKELTATVHASDDRGLRAIAFFAPHQDSVVGGRSLDGKTRTFTQTLTIRPAPAGMLRVEAFLTDTGGNLTRLTASCRVD